MYVSGKFVDHSAVMMKEHDGYANHATTLTQVKSTFQFGARPGTTEKTFQSVQHFKEMKLCCCLLLYMLVQQRQDRNTQCVRCVCVSQMCNAS